MIPFDVVNADGAISADGSGELVADVSP